MNVKRLVARSIKYFRDGFGMYVSYVIGFIGFASSVYYLAIANIRFLRELFPSFTFFVAICFIVIPPVSVAVGWMHYKRTLKPLFDAEQDILAEAHPYNRKLVPGKETQLSAPMVLLSMDVTERTWLFFMKVSEDLKRQGLISEEFVVSPAEFAEWRRLMAMQKMLLEGGRLE